MARTITDFPNHSAPNGEYIYGDIIDEDGSQNGTPINRETNADIHQFFARLMAKFGVASNGLPDNAYNEFQFFQAALATFRKYNQHYFYNPAGLPINLAASTPVDHNALVYVLGSASGGTIGLPVIDDVVSPGEDFLMDYDTVTVTNYCTQSVDINTAASNEYIGGFGSTNLTYTLPTNKKIELVLIKSLNLWLINGVWIIS